MMDKENILNRMNEKLMASIQQDCILGLSNYKWELGLNVFNTLNLEVEMMYNVDGTKVKTIYGKPFELNMKDKDVIKLWREVI